jgi:hypothetical protein
VTLIEESGHRQVIFDDMVASLRAKVSTSPAASGDP